MTLRYFSFPVRRATADEEKGGSLVDETRRRSDARIMFSSYIFRIISVASYDVCTKLEKKTCIHINMRGKIYINTGFLVVMFYYFDLPQESCLKSGSLPNFGRPYGLPAGLMS